MAIKLASINHVRLAVADIERSKSFYMDLLGLNHVTDLGERVVLASDGLFLILKPTTDSSATPFSDDFSENHCGLDRVSFDVESHAVLEEAIELFDEHGVWHSEIVDLSDIGFPMYVLAFRDPDNAFLEFVAPKPQ